MRANLGDGLIEIVVPVTCDQTGDVEISVSFVTGTPDRPAGGIATTEDHPRGPAVVVENWAEPLIAYAWQTLVTATAALSSAGGTDLAGRKLITAGLAISAEGLTVTPMAPHTFLAGSAAMTGLPDARSGDLRPRSRARPAQRRYQRRAARLDLVRLRLVIIWPARSATTTGARRSSASSTPCSARASTPRPVASPTCTCSTCASSPATTRCPT